MADCNDDDLRFDPIRKDPAESIQPTLEWFNLCVRFRIGNTTYSASSVVRPNTANGFEYFTSAGGLTGEAEPKWPKVVAQTVRDGSVTWVCQAPSASSLNIMSSPSAVSDPTGLTVTVGSVVDSTRLLPVYSGGTLGQDYDAVFTVTIDGKTRIGRQKVKVRKR
jgi:hypothetical protein